MIKRGKNIALRGRNQKRFIRISSLGEDYSEDHIRKIIEGDKKSYSSPEIKKPEKSFDMLLDIQAIIAKGKGAGYERWAKVYNIKQVAKVLRKHSIMSTCSILSYYEMITPNNVA